MKIIVRSLCLVAVCAILQLVIAIVCSLFSPLHPDGLGDEAVIRRIWAESVVGEMASDIMPELVISGVGTRYVSGFRVVGREELDRYRLPIDPGSKDRVTLFVGEFVAGLPLASMKATFIGVRETRDVYVADGIVIRGLSGGDDRILPFSLKQNGFAIDVVAMVGLLTVSRCLYVAIVRRHRLKKGLCPKCRYDLRRDHTRGCPECGWGREKESEQVSVKS
jgi:hypothetical protein